MLCMQDFENSKTVLCVTPVVKQLSIYQVYKIYHFLRRLSDLKAFPVLFFNTFMVFKKAD